MRVHSVNDLPEDLRLLVEEGGARSGLMCPACQGGRSGEHSLSMFEPEGTYGLLVRLLCHRAGCGYRALVAREASSSYMAAPVRVAPFRPKPRPFLRPTMARTGALALLLLARYAIDAETSALFVRSLGGDYDSVPTRAVLSCLGPYGQDRGDTLRFLDGSTPKTISYLTTDEPKLAWYHQHLSGVLVIVEDQLSAMTLYSMGYDAVALMGTNLGEYKVAEIMAQHYGKVLLALDKDAFAKACAYARRWPALVPVLLDRDIKDAFPDDTKARLKQAMGQS